VRYYACIGRAARAPAVGVVRRWWGGARRYEMAQRHLIVLHVDVGAHSK
jgi:hypothetical protein